MATTILGRHARLTTPVSGAECAMSSRSEEVRLVVDGELPADLDGYFLQARPHPAGGSSPVVVDGIGLRDGAATRFRATDTGERPCPFGPMPMLDEPVRMAGSPLVGTQRWAGSAIASLPIPDGIDPVWHTVVTAPGRDHGEHLTMDATGQVVRTMSFPLPDSSLVHALAVTARHVVLLDLPVTYRKAADLVGEREPYVLQPGRGARIGLVPRCPDEVTAPVWFDVDPGYAVRAVGAHDDGDRVMLDVVWHPLAPGKAVHGSVAAPVVRWTLDPHARTATSRRLTGPVQRAVADPRMTGRRPNHVFTVSTATNGVELARHDLLTDETLTWALGPGVVAGQPVLVPKTRKGGVEGACWLLLPVERIATREQELLVVDAAEPAAGPVAVVRLPAGPRLAARAIWVNLDNRR